jgi:hypothetical protein
LSAAPALKRQPGAADRIRVVEPTVAHVYQLAAKLRRQEIAAAARIGRDPKRALRLSYKCSSLYRRAAVLAGDAGDEVLAMWGLGGDALSDIGFPWLITSTSAAAHRLALLKIGRRELAAMLAAKRLLIDYVAPDEMAAARFVRFFGFAQVGHGPALAGHGPWARYELRRSG